MVKLRGLGDVFIHLALQVLFKLNLGNHLGLLLDHNGSKTSQVLVTVHLAAFDWPIPPNYLLATGAP